MTKFNFEKNDWKKSALFLNEWWSGVHSHLKNGSERVSALIFFLVSEIWAKLKKLVSVEHVGFHEFFHANLNTNLFPGMGFTLKICQTVAYISMIRQFHEFFEI